LICFKKISKIQGYGEQWYRELNESEEEIIRIYALHPGKKKSKEWRRTEKLAHEILLSGETQ